MSKGLGQIEQEVLYALAKAPDEPTDPVTLASMVYGNVTDAQRSAVRRALASLKRKGLVEGGGRHWRIVDGILQRLAGDAIPGTSFQRRRGADHLRNHPLAEQIRALLNQPPEQRARRAAELIEAIARRARLRQWDAEMDAADRARQADVAVPADAP
jgi:hypothetical protein